MPYILNENALFHVTGLETRVELKTYHGLRLAIDEISKTALRATYTIWLARSNKMFGSWELVERPVVPTVRQLECEGPRYTVISPGYKIPGYLSELSSGKYTAQFKNFTTARMHRHMYGFQWHFGVIFPSQDTI